MRLCELEPSMHREPGQGRCQQWSRALRDQERGPGSRTLPLGDLQPRRDCQQDRRHDVVGREYVLDERSGQGKLRFVPRRDRRAPAPGARARSARPRRPRSPRRRPRSPQPRPAWSPLGRAHPRTAPPSRAGAGRWGATDSCREGGPMRALHRPASARHRFDRAMRERWPPRPPTGSHRASGRRTERFRPPPPNAPQLRRDRATCGSRPRKSRSRDTARAAPNRRTARATARQSSHGRCGRYGNRRVPTSLASSSVSPAAAKYSIATSG